MRNAPLRATCRAEAKLTNYLLLTGAGFSRSWQAWLGFEVFAYLIGCEELSPTTLNLLWRSESEGKGFEYALAELQSSGPADDLAALTDAIIGMFRILEKHLGANGFNSREFVASFDTVFTLNQDLLLEKKCADFVFVPGTRWNEHTGYRSPQMALPPLDEQAPPGLTPYFKLHGSSDLFAEDAVGDRPLLVMGGGKAAAIQQHDILVAFAREFERRMRLPATRMVISGYGFKDTHINEMLAAAVRGSDLKLMINDTGGSQPLAKAPNLADGTTLIEVLRPAIIGFSSRSIREAYGGDDIELQKFTRFFGH